MKGTSSNIIILSLILALGIGLTFIATPDTEHSKLPEAIDFNFHIRPILSDNCFLCHGPDSSSREADLRLDIFEGATAVLPSGNRAIVPGKPSKSRLIQLVKSQDHELMMPPPEMKKQLTEHEIALLEKWIKQGAEWKTYWAFIPPQKTASKKTNIDFFIQKKLAESNLKKAEQAEKSSLIRRLSFALTGLPPTPQEVANFENDDRPDAYEQLVDYYLNSPHFGERWARHWMDLMRYAETRGHEFDFPIMGAWRYRDYLIRAFNQDVPYDQFVKEHLAGDLLPAPRLDPERNTNESILGTAYLGLSEGKHSPVSIREEEVDRIDNMIDVTSKSFQALTVSCAKCHDHKFDPIPTTDYYAMYGMFESTRFAIHPANTPMQALEKVDSIRQLKREIRQLIGSQFKAQLDRGIALTTSYPPNQTNSRADIQLIADFRNNGWKDWSNIGIAFNTPEQIGEPVFHPRSGEVLALEQGRLSSKFLGKGLHGILHSPTFTIQHDSLLIRAAGEYATLRIIIDNFQLIQWPIYGGLEYKLESGKMKDYLFDLSAWKGHKAYVEIHPGWYGTKYHRNHYFDLPQEAWIEAEYVYAFDSLRLKELPQPQVQFSDLAKKINHWEKGNANANDIQTLNQLLKHGKLSAKVPQTKQYVEAQENLAKDLYDSTYIAGVTEGSAVESPVFIRGDYKNLDSVKITHRFLTAIDSLVPFPETGSGRLAFAEAIVHPDNPLTARVMVNRIWHYLFGRGIVATVDNFGLQGKLPSHPELFDYLAISFMENGWSVKQLIREIVLTETFKQSTTASEKGTAIDPENILLHHYPIRRLEAEAIRDALLATSGRLDTRMYGFSEPQHLTEFMKGRGRPKHSGPLDGNGRRSIYIEVLRNFLSPMMLTFDAPIPFSSFGKRNVTNVPAQALALMNNPFVAQQAEYWATELSCDNPPLETAIQQIYQKAFARRASLKELEQAKDFLKEQCQYYEIDLKEINEDNRVWADFCHSIFNMKEFIFLF
jgi:hypothetical protein